VRELETLLKPVVEAAGLELVEINFHGGRGGLLRVTVDRDGGIDLDTITEVSERISRRLDTEGFTPGPYTLEVSSPGLERPLRRPEEFARHTGATVKVTCIMPEGLRTFAGTIVETSPEQVTVAAEDGMRTVAYENIASARTVFVWPERQPKKQAKKGGR